MNEDKIDISVIIPVYKNEFFIDELVSRLKETLNSITNHFEIIFINDGSPDNSWELIKKNASNDSRVTGIRFARNFGQHIAITAGVDCSSGHWLVVMDGDLQDRPEEITKLYQKAVEGYDVVFARRQIRKDNFLKKITSKIFYNILERFTDGQTDPSVANFGIYSRKVIDYFKKMRERNRFFPLFIQWLGFETAYVDVQHGERTKGKSAYIFTKRIKLALDTIIAMSNKPLKISVKLGFFISFISFMFGIWLIIRYLLWGIPVMGWTSLIVSLYFIGGLLLSIAGILGVYIGKIYEEIKARPLYVIDEVANFKK